MLNEPGGPTAVPPIADRPESVGFWAKAWPVLALGFMTLLFVRACALPAESPSAATFDANAATKQANAAAMQALGAVTASTPLDAALKALNLPVINFASGSAEIPSDAKPVLGKVAAVIQLLPASVRLEVSGHTDNTGTADANMQLARQRAQAVVDLLTAGGVPRDRVSAQGYGDTKPVATNATEEGRFHNRRIEFKSLSR